MRLTYIFLALLFSLQCKDSKSNWKKQTSPLGLPYQSYYPDEYSESEKLPLILFLHGAGERGEDNEKQVVHIAPILSSAAVQNENPCILIFPQCPEEDYWAHVATENGVWSVLNSNTPTPAMGKVIALLDELINDPKVDKSRIYLSGLSMGGFGTFDLLSRKPNTFAAAIPICGGADTSKVDRYKHVPLWNFHGAKDPVVSVEFSQQFMSKFIEYGGNPRYTEYHDGDHNVWTRAYEEPGLIPWIFSQKK